MKHTALLIAMFASMSASAGPKGRIAPWPMAEWQTGSLEQAGFSEMRFKNFVHFAFGKYPTFETDSIVLIKNGYVVYERYANGYKRDQKHALWSLGKTMLNALTGVCESRGLLNRNDFLRKYYPAIDAFGRKDIRIVDLLQMSSGLHWIEENADDLLVSDSFDAFYTKDSYVDMAAYVSKRAAVAAPGERFNYSSGDSGLLAVALRGAVGEKDYMTFPWTYLFDKLGMKSVAIERDGAGLLSLHGLGYASSLDIARLGLLYLRKGQVNGEQVLPKEWIDFSLKMAPSQLNTPDPNDRNLQNNQSYGAQIWINKKRPEDKALPFPELPRNAILGLGTRGQILLVLPDEDLILVRTATDSELSIAERKKFRHSLFRALNDSMK